MIFSSEIFYWYVPDAENSAGKTPAERYQYIIDWASRARGINPKAFDELTEWLLGCGEWSCEELSENKKIFTDDILKRFLEQNRILRTELTELEPSGIVNLAVFDALKRFDDELSGNTHANELKEAVSKVFNDFSAVKDPEIMESFAGNVTGPAGTNTVDTFGYINFLKDCDASVQWTLFMPDCTKRQQNGFRVESFEYLTLSDMRFIGVEKDFSNDPAGLKSLLYTLDSMKEYRCGFDYDVILLHHFGKGVDVEPCHALWGRFMSAGAPVPDGFGYVDFIPKNDGKTGAPYISQFAFAKFTGDTGSMHSSDGFDCDAMYDVTRNTILGQNVPIPYPAKYWTAEVYLNGLGKDSTAYLFSIEKIEEAE